MKRFHLFALLCLITLPCLAQFKLSGKVLNTSKRDTFYVNIPFVFGHTYLSENPVVTDAQGNFSTTIDLNEQKFVRLTGKGFKSILLMKPGGSLKLNINTADTTITNFTGSTAAANRLLYQLNLDKKAFFWGTDAESSRQQLTAEAVQEKIFKPLLAERDVRLKLVATSTLPVADKKLIAQEVRAQALNDMSDFVTAVWRTRNRAEFSSMISLIFKDNPPLPEVSPAGMKYYAFAGQYVSYLESEAFVELQKLPAEQQKTTPLKYYGVTLEDGKKLGAAKGKRYIDWLAIKNAMDKTVAEPLLAQYVFNKLDEKMITEASALLDEMKISFPKSRFLPVLNQRMQALKAAKAMNETNANIGIVEGYDKITSIYQVVNQLRGKVIYLDVWGTWCGPCKEELKYNPLLKKHFKGKDVAFVYLDMDDDTKDNSWREFIKVNGLTGWHMRKNSSNIKPFWEELMSDKTQRNLYPTYFIFDKTGKLVEAGANRPSFKELTYKQIEKYL